MKCFQVYLILSMFFILLEIGLGWYSFYNLHHDITSHGNDDTDQHCDRKNAYWIVYAVFQGMVTILDIWQFGLICKAYEEMRHKVKKRNLSFVIFSFLMSSVVTITTLVYLHSCQCSDVDTDQWNERIADLLRGVASGASRTIIQVVIHFTDILIKCGKTFDFDEDEEETSGCYKVINVTIFILTLCLLGAEIYYTICL